MRMPLVAAVVTVALLAIGMAGSLSANNKVVEVGEKCETNTLTTDENGEFDFDVKNKSVLKMSDIHFEVKTAGYKIKDVESDQTVFTNHWPQTGVDDPSGEGGADGGWVDEAGGANAQIAFQLTIVNEEGELAKNKKIKIEICWSRFDKKLTLFSATGIGIEGELTALLSNVIPDYNASPVITTLGEETEATCNDIAIGETYGYRFEGGSLVVKPSNGRFEIVPGETVVKGFDENGDDVTGTAAFGVSNVRINDSGHLVFEVSRDRTDDLHIAIVIRGLKLTGLENAGEPHNIHVGLSGAAISGECKDELIHIVTVDEEE